MPLAFRAVEKVDPGSRDTRNLLLARHFLQGKDNIFRENNGKSQIAADSSQGCLPPCRQFLHIHHGVRTRRVNLRYRRHISDLQRPQAFHCEQHSLLRVHLEPRLLIPDHQHRLTLHQGLKRIFLSQVTGHRPEFQVLAGQPVCVCSISVHPQSLPPSDQHQHQHLSHVPPRPPDDQTTFKHDADNVSTFGYSLRSVFLGRREC